MRPVSTFILAAVIRDEVYLKSARTLTPAQILMVPAQTVRDVFDRFLFGDQVLRLHKSGLLYQVTEPVMARVRRWIPLRGMGIDFSPMIILLAIVFLQSFLVPSLMQLAYSFR